MLKNLAKRFIRNEQGLELSEYAIMAALIIVALLVTIGLLSDAIDNAFVDLTDAINAGS